MIIDDTQKPILQVPINTYYLRIVFTRNFISMIIVIIICFCFNIFAVYIGMNIIIRIIILALFIAYFFIDLVYLINIVYINKNGSPLIIQNSQIIFHNLSILTRFISRRKVVLDLNEISEFLKGTISSRKSRMQKEDYIEIVTKQGQLYIISGLLYDFKVDIVIQYFNKKGLENRNRTLNPFVDRTPKSGHSK
jgi:hypothetical protein